jgi:hypothetical protein
MSLLGLPTEIRAHILSFVLVDRSNPVALSFTGSRLKFARFSARSHNSLYSELQIASLCRQLREDAYSVFFSRNVFIHEYGLFGDAFGAAYHHYIKHLAIIINGDHCEYDRKILQLAFLLEYLSRSKMRLTRFFVIVNGEKLRLRPNSQHGRPCTHVNGSDAIRPLYPALKRFVTESPVFSMHLCKYEILPGDDPWWYISKPVDAPICNHLWHETLFKPGLSFSSATELKQKHDILHKRFEKSDLVQELPELDGLELIERAGTIEYHGPRFSHKFRQALISQPDEGYLADADFVSLGIPPRITPIPGSVMLPQCIDSDSAQLGYCCCEMERQGNEIDHERAWKCLRGYTGLDEWSAWEIEDVKSLVTQLRLSEAASTTSQTKITTYCHRIS